MQIHTCKIQIEISVPQISFSGEEPISGPGKCKMQWKETDLLHGKAPNPSFSLTYIWIYIIFIGQEPLLNITNHTLKQSCYCSFVCYLAILSLHDMVRSLSPCRTPSHVWMVLLERTGMVPSPDSILVLSWPRAFLFGCLSPWSEIRKIGTEVSKEPQTIDQIINAQFVNLQAWKMFLPFLSSKHSW